MTPVSSLTKRSVSAPPLSPPGAPDKEEGFRAPALPVGEEQRGDAVADLQAAHVLADRDDLASAVRAGHEAVGDWAEIGVLADQQVAEVERHRLDRHGHLAVAQAAPARNP
jgi:hypothetical protein